MDQNKLARMEDKMLEPPDEPKVMYTCDGCTSPIHEHDTYVKLEDKIFCHPDIEACMQDWLLSDGGAEELIAGEE